MAENDGAFHLTSGTQLPDGLFIMAGATACVPFCEGLLTLHKHLDDTFERVLLRHYQSRRAPHRHRRRQKRAEQDRRHRISIAAWKIRSDWLIQTASIWDWDPRAGTGCLSSLQIWICPT